MFYPAHRFAGLAAAALLLIGGLSTAAEAAPPIRVFPQAGPPLQTQRPVQPGGDATRWFPQYPPRVQPIPPIYPPPDLGPIYPPWYLPFDPPYPWLLPGQFSNQ